jgi:hypothetical protein
MPHPWLGENVYQYRAPAGVCDAPCGSWQNGTRRPARAAGRLCAGAPRLFPTPVQGVIATYEIRVIITFWPPSAYVPA